MIITKDLIDQAYKLTGPLAKAVIADPAANWGPRWVRVKVGVPGLVESFFFKFGKETGWDPKWGEKIDFKDIAIAKFRLVERERKNASEIVLLKPWLVHKGEYLYAGGAHRDGITVAVSGLHSWADEAISEIFISIIVMLARLKADNLVKQGKELI